MKIRMIAEVSGMRNGVDWPPRGSVMELPDSEAEEYISAGLAVPVTTHAKSERAVADDVTVEKRVMDDPFDDLPAVAPKPTVPRPGATRR